MNEYEKNCKNLCKSLEQPEKGHYSSLLKLN